MKAVRYALSALLCYAAFWGAAQIGLLPILRTGKLPEAVGQAKPDTAAPRQMLHYLPIIR